MLFLFGDRCVPVTLINGGRFLQLILTCNHKTTLSPSDNLTTPTIFEVIIFSHGLSVFHETVTRKTLTVSQDYRARKLIGLFVQRVMKAEKELFNSTPFENSSKTMFPYMLFDNSLSQFKVLSKWNEGLSPLLQNGSLTDDGVR